MTLTESSRERVDGWIADFADRYDSFARVEERWEMSPGYYERTLERFERGENGGAGIHVTNDAGEVLLVRDKGDEGWVDPGGKRESRGASEAKRPASGAGESFEATARRETREETGVECEVTGLFSARTIKIVDETDPGRPTLYSLIAIFTGEPVADDPTPRPREGEIAAVDWFDAPPETVGYSAVAERPFPSGN